MTEEVQPRTCSDCKFAVFADFGYSNWTTEGTTFTCGVKAHPDGSFDHWYGEEKKLEYAAQCPSFVAGDPIWMDCDRDQEAKLTPEQRRIWEGTYDE
jgi:hypothetical protein